MELCFSKPHISNTFSKKNHICQIHFQKNRICQMDLLGVYLCIFFGIYVLSSRHSSFSWNCSLLEIDKYDFLPKFWFLHSKNYYNYNIFCVFNLQGVVARNVCLTLYKDLLVYASRIKLIDFSFEAYAVGLISCFFLGTFSYGSFFGPSQPVIPQRVIQESKLLLENPNLAAKVLKSNHAVCINFNSYEDACASV